MKPTPTKAPVKPKDLGEIWFDPSHPAGFAGESKLRKAAKKTKKETKLWLAEQLPYSLNKPRRRRFPTRPYRTGGINDTWQMDLMEMIPFSSINSGYKYILTCIDIFSRFARALPLKSKGASDVESALKHMLKDVKPYHIQTDLGKEFYNTAVQTLFKKHGIKHYSVYSQFKAALVERFNRTLRERISKYFVATGNKKWVNVLPKFIEAYNNSKHRSIGMRPIDVNKENEGELWLSQNKKVSTRAKYKVGDYVRISRLSQSPFIKNFDHNWSDEVYEIHKIDIKSHPSMYIIKDDYGEIIQGKFYEPELQVIPKPTVYRIQKILSSKGKGKYKQYYVKWHGYSQPTWIKKSSII